jgi:hypothetical protein
VTRYPHVRKRLAALLTFAAAFAVAGPVTAVVPAAHAVPSPVRLEPGDDEGGTKSLRDQLEASSRGFLEAQEALARSKKRQQELTTLLRQIDDEVVVKQASLGEIVRETYRTGRIGPMAAILGASSTNSFLDRATTLDVVAGKEDRALRALRESRTAQEQAKIAIDTEVRNQVKQVNTMAKRKTQAENALKAAQVGGGPAGTVADRSSGSGTPRAAAARRNSDGSLPDESCSVEDPTSGGCITPRTLNAMNQAKRAGFTRFVACFRRQNSGEHPLGRACDFAADKNGFGGVATGSSKSYGDRLANYYIANASRLGVLYVIWFRRIWLPSSGWRSYSRGNGDPSSDHTNHVHLSMR